MITVTPLIPMTFEQYCSASAAVLEAKDLTKARNAHAAASKRLHALEKRDRSRRSRRYDLQVRLRRMREAGDLRSTTALEQKVADLNVLIAAGEAVMKQVREYRSCVGDQYFAARKARLEAAGLPEAWPFKIVVS